MSSTPAQISGRRGGGNTFNIAVIILFVRRSTTWAISIRGFLVPTQYPVSLTIRTLRPLGRSEILHGTGRNPSAPFDLILDTGEPSDRFDSPPQASTVRTTTTATAAVNINPNPCSFLGLNAETPTDRQRKCFLPALPDSRHRRSRRRPPGQGRSRPSKWPQP